MTRIRSPSTYRIGYTSSNGRACHTVISSVTTSVRFEINSREASIPYTSRKCSSISRVVIPRAYNDNTMSSMLPIRRARFGTTFGANDPFRSRGTSIVTGPFRVDTRFVVFPFREFPLPCPAGSPAS